MALSSDLASNMARVIVDEMAAASQEDDAIAFDHVESFNLLCVGESGLGKSTFLRDVFAHLDPTKQQEMRRRVGDQSARVRELEDAIGRNEKEGRQCDDQRALELRAEKRELKETLLEAVAQLEELRREKQQQEQAVADMRSEIRALDEALRERRAQRDAADLRVGHVGQPGAQLRPLWQGHAAAGA